MKSIRDKIIEVAEKEIGYTEGDNGYTKYGEWYGYPNADWCNIFIYWCAKQLNIDDSVILKCAYVPETAIWFYHENRYYKSKSQGGNYTPKRGDIIFFDVNHNNIPDHIGFIENVDSDFVYTIEGNAKDMVKRNKYKLDSNDIISYASPKYN